MSARVGAKTITNRTTDLEEPAPKPLGLGKQPDNGQFRLRTTVLAKRHSTPALKSPDKQRARRPKHGGVRYATVNQE
jgi:hypothetical protein